MSTNRGAVDFHLREWARIVPEAHTHGYATQSILGKMVEEGPGACLSGAAGPSVPDGIKVGDDPYHIVRRVLDDLPISHFLVAALEYGAVAPGKRLVRHDQRAEAIGMDTIEYRQILERLSAAVHRAIY